MNRCRYCGLDMQTGQFMHDFTSHFNCWLLETSTSPSPQNQLQNSPEESAKIGETDFQKGFRESFERFYGTGHVFQFEGMLGICQHQTPSDEELVRLMMLLKSYESSQEALDMLRRKGYEILRKAGS